MNWSERVIQGIGVFIMLFALEIDVLVVKLFSPDGNIQSIKILIFIFGISLFFLFFGMCIFLNFEKINKYTPYLNPVLLYKHKKKEMLLLLIISLICFSFLEITARIIIPEREITKYGWTTPANTTYTMEFDDTPNVTRNITVTYFNFGFKRWGNLTTNKTKVFVIGDSSAAMHFVSNGEEWYAHLEKEFPNTEFFVYGSSGYGSLQEYMILNDFIDVIKPDVILWQFSANDFFNNLYSYERKNVVYATRAFRPYLEGEKIVYKIPRPFGIVRRYSYFINFLLEKYDSFLYELELAKIQHDLSRIKHYPQDEEQSFNITVRIMQMVSNRAGDTPVYFFSGSPMTPHEALFFNNLSEQEMLLCQNANITYIRGVAEYINEKEKQNIIVRVADSHWNVAGNKFVGEFLINYFQKNQVLNKQE